MAFVFVQRSVTWEARVLALGEHPSGGGTGGGVIVSVVLVLGAKCQARDSRVSPLDRLCFSSFAREHPLELVARADFQLREHLVQVVLNGPRADE